MSPMNCLVESPWERRRFESKHVGVLKLLEEVLISRHVVAHLQATSPSQISLRPTTRQTEI